jgi:hypothetical protein
MTAHEALELAETMTGGEAAAMYLASQLMGVDYEEFLDRLVGEHESDEQE